MNTNSDYFEIGKEKFYRYDRTGAVKDFQQALTIDPDNQLVTGWLAITLALLKEYEESESVLGTFDDTETSEAYIAKGIISKFRDGENQLAIEQFSKAISIDPHNDIAFIHRGIIYAFINQKDDALSDLEQALQINPNSYAYSNSGYIKGRLGDREGAIPDLKKATDLDTKNIRPWAYLGFFQDEAGDHKKALSSYDKTIELDSEYVWALFRRGRLKWKFLDDNPGALIDLNKAIELDPEYKDAWAERGKVREKLEDPEGPLFDYNRALELDQDYYLALYRRGRLKRQYLEDPDGAIIDLNRAIEINPRFEWSYLERGYYYSQIGKPNAALEDFNKAIELKPEFEKPYYGRGVLKKDQLNDPKGAILDLHKYIKLNPRDCEGWLQRAELLAKNSEYERALADYNKALELEPEMIGALIDRSRVKYELIDYPGALNDLNKATDIDPGNKIPWAGRGLIKENNGDKEGAIKDYSRSLVIDKDFSWALNQRAKLLKSLGQYDLSLVDRSRYYEVSGIPNREYKDSQHNEVFQTVNVHLDKILTPNLKNLGEKLLEYWICYLRWGAEEKQSLSQGKQNNLYYGFYGLGYLCLSDKYLRILSLGLLSKKYAKIMGIGFAKKLIGRYFSDYDYRTAEKKDQEWIIPFKDIQSITKTENYISLVTPSEKWEVGCYVDDNIEYLQAALDYARSGNLRRMINLDNIKIASNTSGSKEDIPEVIERLASLRGKGLISNEEFEQKKKELLARL